MKYLKKYYNFKSERFGAEAIVVDIVYAPMLIGGIELKIYTAEVVKVIQNKDNYHLLVGDRIPVYINQCIEVPEPDTILKEIL